MYNTKKEVKAGNTVVSFVKEVNTADKLMGIAQALKSDVEYAYALLQMKNATNGVFGGSVRQTAGEILEKNVMRTLHKVCVLAGLNTENFKLVKGDTLGKGVKCTNVAGSVNAGVDCHLFINDVLTIAIECKTYLDARNIVAGLTHLRTLKEKHNTTTLFLSLEDAINRDTLNYYLLEGKINAALFLMHGKRSSARPIYLKEFTKEIDINTAFDFVNLLYATVRAHIK